MKSRVSQAYPLPQVFRYIQVYDEVRSRFTDATVDAFHNVGCQYATLEKLPAESAGNNGRVEITLENGSERLIASNN